VSDVGHGTGPRIALWQDVFQKPHWVLQVGRLLVHYYGKPRLKPFYFRRLSKGDTLNLPDDEPEFRMVFGV